MTIIATEAHAAYTYIVDYKAAHDGNSPTVREIRDYLGLSSTSLIASRLKYLARAGLIRLPDGAIRSIEVVGGAWRPPEGINQ